MDVLAEVTQAIAELRRIDPRLHTALSLLNQQLHKITRVLEPIEARSTLQQAEEETPVDAPVVGYIFTGRTIRFAWTDIPGAALYEVRKGSDWDTATFQFRTASLSADIDPVSIGSHTYLFKSINTGGIYSEGAFEVVVLVTPIDPVVITGEVIDNNVLIDWAEPSSVFAIDHYDIYKDGVYLTFVRSSFYARAELISGTYIYRVIAVDVVGNQSANSELALDVSSPLDYILYDVHNSDLSGTLDNIILESDVDKLVGPVDTTISWEDHFIDNTWTSPQDQVDDGFPIYIQPSTFSANPDGYYEEIVDYGTAISSVIVTITWNFNQFDNSDLVQVTIQMATSLDGISYTAFSAGAAQLRTDIRYLKFRVELNAPTNKALMEIFDLRVSLSIKRENDGGFGNSPATDTLGTVVYFNKAFIDVESITVTPISTSSCYAVVDFSDIPNPDSFKVRIYDNAGVRITKDFRWDARGIL
jgi:hypothetical protein